MKILITTECYLPVINGVVTSIVNLRKELQLLGHDVRILTLSSSSKSFHQDGVYYLSSLSVGKIYPGARISLSTHHQFLEEIIKWQPDIVHSQCEFSTFRIAKHIAKMVSVPIVHTYHTIYEDYTHYFSPNHKWGKAMVALFTRKILKHATTVIAPTKKVRALLQSYRIDQPVSVVPTGIYLKQFTESLAANKKQFIFDTCNIPHDHQILLFVGRLAKEKNIEEILSYFAQLAIPKLTFLIVGDGPHRDYLQHYAEQLSITHQVKFTGLIEPKDIASYYQVADLFVSASNSETQGLTYIEALASGIPAICRQDPCLENVVTNGVNGFQYLDYTDFSNAVCSLLKDPTLYQQFSINAAQGIVRDYSSRAFAVKIQDIYENTIASYYLKMEYVC
ncbi:glycosyltransferase [Paraliobacillus sediminis]|uniref:glycosyltransferase n=1 Tax=Paraliobacillus sediminis TaxID=1885916 RepID=UPI000E3C3011|nr:glycosyltransferase [Paraliobacillus sediminis]